MPAYANPPAEPVTISEEWQATGRTRLRSSWFGLLLIEIEQSAMVQTGPRRNGQALGSWQEVRRWRRASRGHTVTMGADLFGAYRRGKADRH
jgi:hypothetical protein